MIGSIIHPLQIHSGIEGLRDVIMHAEMQLRVGLLHNPREVEVALKSGGRVSTQAAMSSTFSFNLPSLAPLPISSCL